MQNFFKNPIIILLTLAVIGLIGGVGYYAYTGAQSLNTAINSQKETSSQLADLEKRLEYVREERAKKPINEQKTDKVIFESPDSTIGSEASFAPLFDMFLDIAKLSGLKIRSIGYTYDSPEDIIAAAHLTNYNVCVMNIQAVGSYRNFQSFFRAVAKEPYLMSLLQIDIKPWENNRLVLIGDIKLGLYTKSH